jgi:hypothetical protein
VLPDAGIDIEADALFTGTNDADDPETPPSSARVYESPRACTSPVSGSTKVPVASFSDVAAGEETTLAFVPTAEWSFTPAGLAHSQPPAPTTAAAEIPAPTRRRFLRRFTAVQTHDRFRRFPIRAAT